MQLIQTLLMVKKTFKLSNIALTERQIMINEIMEDNEEVVSTNTPSKEDLLDSIFSSSKEEEFDTLKYTMCY